MVTPCADLSIDHLVFGVAGMTNIVRIFSEVLARTTRTTVLTSCLTSQHLALLDMGMMSRYQ